MPPSARAMVWWSLSQIKQLEKYFDLRGIYDLQVRITSRVGKSMPEIRESAPPVCKSLAASSRLSDGIKSMLGKLLTAALANWLVVISGKMIFMRLLYHEI